MTEKSNKNCRFIVFAMALLLAMATLTSCEIVYDKPDAKPDKPVVENPSYLRFEYRSDEKYGEYGASLVRKGAKLETLVLRSVLWRCDSSDQPTEGKGIDIINPNDKSYELDLSDDSWVLVNIFDGWDDVEDIKYLKHVKIESGYEFSDRATEQFSRYASNVESWEYILPQ